MTTGDLFLFLLSSISSVIIAPPNIFNFSANFLFLFQNRASDYTLVKYVWKICATYIVRLRDKIFLSNDSKTIELKTIYIVTTKLLWVDDENNSQKNVQSKSTSLKLILFFILIEITANIQQLRNILNSKL